MFEADLHSHSHFSRCGVHSVIEMLQAARGKGVKVQAVTDHGPAKVDRICSTFFTRLGQPVEGIRLLKGMECNLVDESGRLDMDPRYIPFCDVLLAGLHDNLPPGWDGPTATEALVRAMETIPWLDVITHPLCSEYDLDLRRLARTARDTGKALEFNNSKVALGSVSAEAQKEFMAICREEGCLVAVDTDAHTVNETGDLRAMEALLEETDFPEELILNRSADKVLDWLESRRPAKQALS